MPSPSKTAATSAALFPKREEGKNDTNKDHLPLKFLDCLKIFKSQRKNVVIFSTRWAITYCPAHMKICIQTSIV